MNKYSDQVRRVINVFRYGKFILFLTPVIPILKKLLPIHIEYAENTNQTVWRDGVLFNLDISDYIPWSVDQKPVIFLEFTPSWYLERQVDAFVIWTDSKVLVILFIMKINDFEILSSVYQTNILAISKTTNP